MGGTFGKSGSWVVDHSMDQIPLHPRKRDSITHGSIATVTTISKNSEPPPYDEAIEISLYESPKEKKARRRSHWVAYTTMFVMSIGFSIVLSGVWPYLQNLNPDLDKESLGLIVAANPLGQLIASPILGYWGNKAGSIRFACLTTVFFFIIGNVMYGLLYAFKDLGGMASYWAMFVSRFIVGVSSANVALCRSYLASSTTLKERTSGIAIIAAAQALGFVVGPGIQTILTLTITEETKIAGDWFIWDKFTSAGWVAAILGLINLIVLMPCVFQEYNIADKERALMDKLRGDRADMKLPKPDYVALLGILLCFFATIFIYVLLETLAVPFVMDQYAWEEDKAMVIVGIALMGAGLISTGLFPFSGVLARKYDERKVMLIPGYVPIIIGSFLFIPYAGDKIPMQECWNIITTMEPTTIATTIASMVGLIDPASGGAEVPDNCSPGCPQVQEWCNDTPQLPLPQLTIAFITVFLGYPIAQSICMSIYSKMLGPKPQGLWMGILTGVGSFGRIMGPIFVSLVYTNLGSIWTFSLISILMVVSMLVALILYKRLIPMKVPTADDMRGIDGPAKEKY